MGKMGAVENKMRFIPQRPGVDVATFPFVVSLDREHSRYHQHVLLRSELILACGKMFGLLIRLEGIFRGILQLAPPGS